MNDITFTWCIWQTLLFKVTCIAFKLHIWSVHAFTGIEFSAITVSSSEASVFALVTQNRNEHRPTFFFSNNLLKFDVHHNMEEKMWCSFRYIVTLNGSSVWWFLDSVWFRVVIEQFRRHWLYFNTIRCFLSLFFCQCDLRFVWAHSDVIRKMSSSVWHDCLKSVAIYFLDI